MYDETWRDLPKSFHVIKNIPDTQAAQSAWVLRWNIWRNNRRGLQKLHLLPDYGKYKGAQPLAIVAGGPSLNNTLGELRTMKRIMVCGTAHDHVVALGFKPDYAVISDAAKTVAAFLKTPVRECMYLVATTCDRSVFDALKGFNVVTWNNEGLPARCYDGEPRVQGGCTVTLRAMNIAILLGFLNLHFFGFDSSWPKDGKRHAYDSAFNPEDKLPVRVIGTNGLPSNDYVTNKEWMAQALHFQEMMRHIAYMTQVTIHGDGLIAEIMKNANGYADKVLAWSQPGE